MNTTSGFYVLNDDKSVTPVKPPIWAQGIKQTKRQVDLDRVENEWFVSTVFIGIDYMESEKYPNIFSSIASRKDGKTVSLFSPTWETAQAVHTLMLTTFIHNNEPDKSLLDFLNNKLIRKSYAPRPELCAKSQLPDPIIFHFAEFADIEVQKVQHPSLIADALNPKNHN